MTLLELRDEINAFMEEYPFASDFTAIISSDPEGNDHRKLEQNSMTIVKVKSLHDYYLDLDDIETPEEGNAVWIQ